MRIATSTFGRLAAGAGLTLAAALLSAVPAGAATPTIRTFPLTQSPHTLASGADGVLWAAGTDTLIRIDSNGQSQVLTNPIPPGAGLRGIVAGPDGGVWSTGGSNDKIYESFPDNSFIATDGITTFNFPLASGAAPAAITAAADGTLWFFENGLNKLARITVAGAVNDYALAPGTFVSDLTAGPDGFLWYASTHGVVRFSTATATSTSFTAGFTGTPTTIASGPDGNLWVTETGIDKIARVTPAGVVTEFPTVANHHPSAIAAGPDGNLWFTTSSSMIGRITPAGVVTEFDSGLGNDITAGDIIAGPDGNVWFGATPNSGPVAGYIGRITTEQAPFRYTDQGKITVPAPGGTSGPADIYPATINVAGLQGTVTKVRVRLNGVHHGRSNDLLVQLIGPTGQRAIVLAHVTSNASSSPLDVLNGDVLTFESGGQAVGPHLTSGAYAPYDSGFTLGFTGAAAVTGASPPANLGVFNGTDPNGAWKLFVYDDADDGGNTFSTGDIARGWSLDLETTGPNVQVPGPTVTVPGPTTTVPAPADTTKPTLTLGKFASTVALPDFKKGITIPVTSSEPVTLDGVLAASSPLSAKPAKFPIVLSEFESALTGTQAFKFTPDAKLLSKAKANKPFAVRVRLVATDSGGNRTTLVQTITVGPVPKTKVKAKPKRR